MTLRLALFDCDGTLVDSQLAIVAAMRAGFAAVGREAPEDLAIRRVVGLALVEAVAALLPADEPDLAVEIAEAYKAAFHDNRLHNRHPEPLFPGVREALDALEAAGCLLGIATGKSRRGLIGTLEHHGLLSRFVTLQTSDLLPGKPHPDMVHHAMAEAGVERDATVVIGDTTFDVLMARNAGVACVGVAWGYHRPAELLAAGAVTVVDAYAAVPDAVLALMPAPAVAGASPC